MKASELSLTAIFAALYVVGVVSLAPVSFMVIQVRMADALLPISMLLGWPAVIGFSIGALIGNVFGGLGPIDMAGGAVANFVGCGLAYLLTRRGYLHKKFFIGCWIINLPITFIVGTYLSFLPIFPPEQPIIQRLMISWPGIFVGTFIAVNICGYILLWALIRTGILRRAGYG